MSRLPLLVLLLAQTSRPAAESLQLRIESPPELSAVRTRLESVDRRRFGDIIQLAGLNEPGSPIRVVLAPENSDFARGVAPWISGYAVGASDLVVIFPARSPGYPHDSVEDVLRHEIAHVLIWRAAGGPGVPRWFDEGLAMSAERERRFEDQTQLLYQLVSSSGTNLDELSRLFAGGQGDQVRAYALAGAVVHDVLERFGLAVSGEIFKGMRRGASFDEAFNAAAGLTLGQMEAEFWHRQRIWTTWLPIVTSSTALWLAVTLLAILAIHMRRRRNREIEKRWESEEDEDDLEP